MKSTDGSSGLGRARTAWLLLLATTSCGWAPATESENPDLVTFRCIDNGWFTVRGSNRSDEIVVVRPMRIQVRLQKVDASDGAWRFRAGGYTLSGNGSEAVWVAENGLPIRCTADSLPKFTRSE